MRQCGINKQFDRYFAQSVWTMHGRVPKSVACPICGRQFMRHSLKFHLKKCQELYKKWDGFKSMPCARNYNLLYSSDLLKIEEYSASYVACIDRDISPYPRGAWDELMETSVYAAAGDAENVHRLQCRTCARGFCPERLARCVLLCD